MEGVNSHPSDAVGRLEIVEKDSPNRGHTTYAHTVSLHSHHLAYYDMTPGKQLIIGRNKAWQGFDMCCVGIKLM